MKESYHILSLGAGVQSTMLALLGHLQIVPDRVPKFDAAIFADTGEEPQEVYTHLDWLTERVKPSYPILIRSAGKLGEDLLHGKGEHRRFASIPAFTAMQEGENLGIARRQCSREYKVDVIDRAIRRDIVGLAPRQRMPKNVVIHNYIGLSAEEGRRIEGRGGKGGVRHRIESTPWARAHFPLYDMKLTRQAILHWLKDKVPHITPRSACVFCPYHDDKEWQNIKDNSPQDWQRAVQIDTALRNGSVASEGLIQKLYLHRSCLPLEQVEFKPKAEDQEENFNFSALECEGMCGL